MPTVLHALLFGLHVLGMLRTNQPTAGKDSAARNRNNGEQAQYAFSGPHHPTPISGFIRVN
jgi:hypothetical protein